MNKIQPSIVLVRPQMGENIGAAARAMLNFGLTDLRIIAPRDGWPNQAAIDMAAGAFDEMPPPRLSETLAEGCAELHFLFATTARMRDMAKPIFTAAAAAQESHTLIHSGARVGFVFGAERTGLINDEVAACHAILNIPVNPAFPSLNLAQAVSLIAYEWFQHEHQNTLPATGITSHAPMDALASHAELENLFTRLETELTEGGFFKTPEIKPVMVRNIKNFLLRADMTAQETRTFHGMIAALKNKKI